VLALQAHAAPGPAQAVLAAIVVTYAGCFRLGEVIPVAALNPREQLRIADLRFGPHDENITLQVRVTKTSVGAFGPRVTPHATGDRLCPGRLPMRRHSSSTATGTSSSATSAAAWSR
jgi:hypothetical protein